MEKRTFAQTGAVIDADVRPVRHSPMAQKTQSVAWLVMGASISVLSLIVLTSFMLGNWSLYLHSMSLLLQVLIWALMIGIPVTVATWLALRVRNVVFGALDQRDERRRLNTMHAAQVNLLNAQAAKEQAEAMLLLRTVPFDANGNSALVGIDPTQVVQLYGQYAKPVAGARADQKLLEAGNDDPESDTIEKVVSYESVADQVPSELSLLGIYPTNGQLEIVSPDNYKTAWFVGGSNMGKTNTVYGKVADAVRWGAKLIICDNHAHKDDSLANKLGAFHHRLQIPIAQTDQDIKDAILYFLNEFKARRDDGRPCTEKWLIVTDEVNATSEHIVKVNDVEKRLLLEEYGIEVANNKHHVKLKVFLQALAQTCGYESRGFEMFGYFISQKVAGLSWLRNAMMTVFVHGLLMDSEALLAANNDRKLADLVKSFKKGRTLVYGYEFEQPLILQQPKYNIVEGSVSTEPLQSLPVPSSAQNIVEIGRYREEDREGAQEAAGRNAEENSTSNQFELKKLFAEIAKMKADGKSNDFILKHFNLTPGGRNNQNLKAVADVISEFDAVEQ